MSESFFKEGNGLVQLSQAMLEERIADLGKQITEDYAGKSLHLVSVLNGAFIFTADLVRQIDLPLSIDFIGISSYGSRTESSGEVRLTKDLASSVKKKDVLIIEDIVDTGLTMQYLLSYFQMREPASVKVASLLSKPSRRKVDVNIDYTGFEIDDAFVYGYGLDVDHIYRNLPFITSKDS